MKRNLTLVVALGLLLMSFGCLAIPIDMPTVSVHTTGFPVVYSRNQVVVTCPKNLSLLKVEKLDQFGKTSWALKPGESIGVRPSGMYADQTMVIVVYGYNMGCKNAKGEDTFLLVGRTSRNYSFYDNGNSGQMYTWDVQMSELQ